MLSLSLRTRKRNRYVVNVWRRSSDALDLRAKPLPRLGHIVRPSLDRELRVRRTVDRCLSSPFGRAPRYLPLSAKNVAVCALPSTSDSHDWDVGLLRKEPVDSGVERFPFQSDRLCIDPATELLRSVFTVSHGGLPTTAHSRRGTRLRELHPAMEETALLGDLRGLRWSIPAYRA